MVHQVELCDEKGNFRKKWFKSIYDCMQYQSTPNLPTTSSVFICLPILNYPCLYYRIESSKWLFLTLFIQRFWSCKLSWFYKGCCHKVPCEIALLSIGRRDEKTFWLGSGMLIISKRKANWKFNDENQKHGKTNPKHFLWPFSRLSSEWVFWFQMSWQLCLWQP